MAYAPITIKDGFKSSINSRRAVAGLSALVIGCR